MSALYDVGVALEQHANQNIGGRLERHLNGLSFFWGVATEISFMLGDKGQIQYTVGIPHAAVLNLYVPEGDTPAAAAIRVVDSQREKPSEEPEPRAETGVMKFGTDWPGVFIRGDNAFAYADGLQTLLDKARKDLSTVEGSHDLVAFTAVLTLENLLRELRDSEVGRPKSTYCVEQSLKPFKDCK